MYGDPEQPLRELALSEPLKKRARLMTESAAADSANGIKMVRVISVDKLKDAAKLEVHFFNLNYLKDIILKYKAVNSRANRIFPISGGSRFRAGGALGQVQVDSSGSPANTAITMPVSTHPVLNLVVKPIGDYSTYLLGINELAGTNWKFDPLFAEISFKFRPGCFNTNCAPEWETGLPPLDEPVIDYLAKDYGSFRQTMIDAMVQRVPEWQPTSEADLDMVLAELFAVAADELSDYQDRVMNEAYLASARKRVSLARHARLMDYHIHQGNQASTWLAIEIGNDEGVKKSFNFFQGFKVWAGESTADVPKEAGDSSVVFISRHKEPQVIHQYLNNIGLYNWGDTITTLKAGSTRADLKLYDRLYLDGSSPVEPISTEPAANAIRDLIRDGNVKYLLIEEHLNPETGLAPGRDPNKRQLLRLLSGDDGAESIYDPVEDQWMVRVRWEKESQLKRDYCFKVICPADNPGTEKGPVDNISLFHGNLVQAYHGRETTTIFKESGDLEENPEGLEFHFERTTWGTLCRLPEAALAYRKTEPGGDEPPFSTLAVQVTTADGTEVDWFEVPSLIHSDDSAELGNHFVVETDEQRRSLLRFGNGKNGMELPDKSIVTCDYQVGMPLDGNIGADILTNFGSLPTGVDGALAVRSCRNPFDVTDGRDREPPAEIIRRIPESYRQRQLRAVTLADYVARAEKITGVSRAAARYAWTGSWRTVRVTIDPAGTNELSYKLRKEVEQNLNAVRLIGEDLEVRPPAFVPLEIKVKLCAAPDVWVEDIKFVLEQEFSDGWTPDGRKGFFHPDEWTFGQPIYASQIIGRAMKVKGVEHIAPQKKNATDPKPLFSVLIKRWNTPSAPVESLTEVNYNEIILVQNDPDHMERGTITFEVKGGRQ